MIERTVEMISRPGRETITRHSHCARRSDKKSDNTNAKRNRPVNKKNSEIESHLVRQRKSCEVVCGVT